MSEAAENVNVLNYIKMFFRRKEFLVVGAMIGLAGGIALGELLPKEYISSTVILVEEGKTDNPLFDKLAVSTTVQERLINIRESLLGWYSIVELVKRLKLDEDVRNQRQYNDLIEGIRKRISITLKGTNVLYLSYTSSKPIETQAVVQNITDIFVNRNKEIQEKETADAITFIEEQLKVYKGKIKSAEIAELQDRLNELMIDSTDKHPLVKQVRERIDAKMDELKKDNLEFTEANILKTESNQKIIQQIQSALTQLEGAAPDAASTDAGLYKFMLLDKFGDVVARDAKVNEEIYNILLERLETAKITQRLQMSKEGTRYTIVDPPRVPLSPFRPRRELVAVAGLFIGLAAGAGLLFMIEFFDKSFIDVEDAKEYLGVPLLGAISRIATDEELARGRHGTTWLYVLTGILSLSLIFGAMTLANVLKINI